MTKDRKYVIYMRKQRHTQTDSKKVVTKAGARTCVTYLLSRERALNLEFVGAYEFQSEL